MNPANATPHATLLAELMNPNNPKNEREHAAVREIERLQKALAQPEQEPVAYASIKMRVGNIYAQQFITQEMLHNADDPWRLITIYAEQCIEELKEKNT